MYAKTSEQLNFNLDVTTPEWQDDDRYPRQTWWNRSVGPMILTTALAPVALTAMGAGCLILCAATTGLSVSRRLTQFLANNRSSTISN